MAVGALPYPKFKAFKSGLGTPLSAGMLYTLKPGTVGPVLDDDGNVLNAKTTYSDFSGSTPNANPIVLNSSGEAVVGYRGKAKLVLYDASGTLVWSIDNVSATMEGDTYNCADYDSLAIIRLF